jgi:hypothetical protein
VTPAPAAASRGLKCHANGFRLASQLVTNELDDRLVLRFGFLKGGVDVSARLDYSEIAIQRSQRTRTSLSARSMSSNASRTSSEA